MLRRPWLVAGVVFALAILGQVARAGAQTIGRAQADDILLEQNFPNPFSPGASQTIFTYFVPDKSTVRLTIYDLIANEIVTLVDDEVDAGQHRVVWDGSDANGNFVPGGFYFYRLDAGEDRVVLRRLRVLSGADP